uniref:Uncharacterized protein n=1 Tax=Arundo donax TaxID=35708 RepID=A0A0A8YH47_ARUDO
MAPNIPSAKTKHSQREACTTAKIQITEAAHRLRQIEIEQTPTDYHPWPYKCIPFTIFSPSSKNCQTFPFTTRSTCPWT